MSKIDFKEKTCLFCGRTIKNKKIPICQKCKSNLKKLGGTSFGAAIFVFQKFKKTK